VNKALLDQRLRSGMLDAAHEPVGGSPEQLALLVERDSVKYARLAKELKIKAD
jgi:hypothetical protein